MVKKSQRGQKGKGRTKLEIKKIVETRNLYCAFSHRRTGLFGKAKELNAVCGADIAVIVFSPKGRLYSYGQRSVDLVADRFLREQQQALNIINSGNVVRSDDSACSGTNKDDFLEDKKGGGGGGEKDAMKTENNLFEWDKSVEDLELHELEQCEAAIEEFRKRVATRLDEMVMRRACLKDLFGMGSNVNTDSSRG